MTLSFDWVLWLTIIAVETALALFSLRREAWRSFPSFSIYICFQAGKSLILLTIWLYFRNQKLYSLFSILFSLLGTVLLVAVLRGIWNRTMGPRMSRPPRTTIKFVGVLAGIYPACLMVAAVSRARGLAEYFTALMSIDVVVTAATVGTLLAMGFYATRLRIPIGTRTARISAGLVLCLLANAVAISLAGKFGISVVTAQRVGQMAYLLTLGLWWWALWEKAPVVAPLTAEEVARMRTHHSETMKVLRQCGVDVQAQ
jgi:sulfite exporter TauE/SafE